MTDTLFTLPNLITLSRVLAVLPAMWLIRMGTVEGNAHYLWMAVALVLVCELTDWLDGYLFALSGPIYAGTNEVQRNIIAERILGLPRK